MLTIKKKDLDKLKEAANAVATEIELGTLKPGRGSCSQAHVGNPTAPHCTLGHFFSRLGILNGDKIEGPVAKLVGIPVTPDGNVDYNRINRDDKEKFHNVNRVLNRVFCENDSGRLLVAAGSLRNLPRVIENNATVLVEGPSEGAVG